MSWIRDLDERYGLSKLGWKKALQYFIFQRMLRINGAVPWPVHWSSLIVHPARIERIRPTGTLGGMPGCYIQAFNGIRFDQHSLVGPGVKLISSNHDVGNLCEYSREGPINIGKHCWLGANSIILPGVRLGDNTVVAAGAVVTKSCPDGNCVLAGVPAKVIRRIDPIDDAKLDRTRHQYCLHGVKGRERPSKGPLGSVEVRPRKG